MNQEPENSVNLDVLAKYFADTASDEEAARIDSWRESSAKNEAEYQQLYLVWIDTGVMVDSSGSDLSINIEEAWSKLNSEISETKTIPIKKTGKWRQYYQVAAVLLVLMGGYLVSMIAFGDQPMEELLATDEIINRQLADGTTITLNHGSGLTYPVEYADHLRKVYLKGEAFFDVARDTTRPFVIEAGDARVEVLGTSFNVEAFPDRDSVVVYVESGKVRLSSVTTSGKPGKASVTLNKGAMGVLDLNTGEIRTNFEVEPRGVVR